MTTTYIPNQAPKLTVTKLQAAIAAGAIALSALAVTAWPSSTPTSEVAPAGVSIDQASLADWAIENGLSGLSPASVANRMSQPSIRDYATVNGLSGLSPASLAPAE